MARRRARRRNPSALQLTLIGLGVVSAAGLGYGIYELVRRSKLSSLPPPPEALPLPTGCGRQYPGFVFDGTACVPGPHTPPGVYVNEACTDFVFVRGDEGPQLDLIEQIVMGGAASSAAADQPSADPAKLAASFLASTWPGCAWPPVDATARIQQLYVAMVYVIGREILLAGGRVLGTTSSDILDQQILERLEGLGLPDYDPDIVPEIDLPDIDEDEVDLSVLQPMQLN